MKRTALAVRPLPKPFYYLEEIYIVYIADSFEEAKTDIEHFEKSGRPFDELWLPVNDERAFYQFLDWIKTTHRDYPFAIHGYRDPDKFIEIRDDAREKGFRFMS